MQTTPVTARREASGALRQRPRNGNSWIARLIF